MVTSPPGVGVGGGWRESPQELQSHQRVTFAQGDVISTTIRLHSRKRILMKQESGLKGRKKEAKTTLFACFLTFHNERDF